MGGEGLSRLVLGVWDKIPVRLQRVRPIAHRQQLLDLLPKELTGFDRSSSTVKAEDPANVGVHR